MYFPNQTSLQDFVKKIYPFLLSTQNYIKLKKSLPAFWIRNKGEITRCDFVKLQYKIGVYVSLQKILRGTAHKEGGHPFAPVLSSRDTFPCVPQQQPREQSPL
jgi:hypothetical protein